MIRSFFGRHTSQQTPPPPPTTEGHASAVPQDVHIGAVESASREGLQHGGVGAVFLDRDGVINDTAMPVGNASVLKRYLLPGAVEAIARLSRGYPGKVIVVTNQSYLSRAPQAKPQEEAVERLLAQMVADQGGRIDALYYCPNPKNFVAPPGHEGGRKPEAGMLLAASHDDPSIDLSKSYMIGDQTTDMAAGARADPDLTRVLVQTGHGGDDGKANVEPHHVARDLSAAVDWIIAREQKSEP